jgi:hypothetical protein
MAITIQAIVDAFSGAGQETAPLKIRVDGEPGSLVMFH